MNLLTTMGALPLLGSLFIALMPAANTKLIKQIALAVSLLVAGVGISAALGFEANQNGFQYVEKYSWIPALGINYQLGVDGISLILILLSVLLVPIVIVGGWNESENGRFSVKTFYVLILILETMMIGVFAATDLFLFYVYSSVSLSLLPSRHRCGHFIPGCQMRQSQQPQEHLSCYLEFSTRLEHSE